MNKKLEREKRLRADVKLARHPLPYAIKRRVAKRSLPVIKGKEPGTLGASRNVPGSSIYVYSKIKQPNSVRNNVAVINYRRKELSKVLFGAWGWKYKSPRTIYRKIIEANLNTDAPVSRRADLGYRRYLRGLVHEYYQW